ncbi:MAG TPA: carboxypeptidase-like regulatory domain-containing protein [Dokdonella sp.]
MFGSWATRIAAAVCTTAVCSSAIAQTHVHGSISDATSGTPVAAAEVRIQAPALYQDTVIGTTTSASDGTYAWDGVCASSISTSCRVLVTADGYVGGYGTFDFTATDAQVDVALHRPARVSGQVRWAADGTPASGLLVSAVCASSAAACQTIAPAYAYTASDGSFTLDAMPPGTYIVCTGGTDENSVAQCYDHSDRGAFADDQPSTAVTLSDDEALDSIDFDLSPGGALGGTVSDGYLGIPLGNHPLQLVFYDANGAAYDTLSITTAEDGRYELRGIAEGIYYLEIIDSSYSYADYAQLFPAIACVDSTCPPVTSAQPWSLATGATLSGVNFTFHPTATISGTITDGASGLPLGGIRVQATGCEDDQCGLLPPIAVSDAVTGAYTLDVPQYPAIHVVTASSRPYVDLAYPDVPCIYRPSCQTSGQDLPIEAGEHLQNIDFTMQMGASISGQVSTALAGPAPNALVSLYDARFNLVWSGYADADGRFESPAWLPGSYFASADNGWGCSFYSDRPCPSAGQDPSTVQPTPIALVQGEVLGHIDFTLPSPDPIFQSGFED